MAVKVGSAESGKVLAATQDSRLAESAQELARITNRLPRISRNRARAQHTLRFLETQVNTRREIGIEAQRPKLLTDQLPVPAETA